jgi:hypothetical protein
MPFAYRLEDYARYRELVGDATYIDITRRTDPACLPQVWDNLSEVVATYGAPWVVQLWTKDIVGALRWGQSVLQTLVAAGTTVTAQVTVTGLAGTVWEPLVPPDGLRHIPRLAALIGGPEHIKWRYDPIIPTLHDPRCYLTLARQSADVGISQGVINFVAPPGRYARVDRRLSELLPSWAVGMPDYDLGWQQATARELVSIATEAGLTLACCAESAALAERVPGLRRAVCGDYTWFVALSDRKPISPISRGSRAGCGCARYFDVGNYGNWSRCHRCVYCYAG